MRRPDPRARTARPSAGVPATVRDNLVATHRLLAAARAARVRRVVWASSSSVYGDVSGAPAAEERPLGRPPSPYAATKRACEGLAQLAWVRARRGRALAASEREDEARRPPRVGRDDREGLREGALEHARALAE